MPNTYITMRNKTLEGIIRIGVRGFKNVKFQDYDWL